MNEYQCECEFCRKHEMHDYLYEQTIITKSMNINKIPHIRYNAIEVTYCPICGKELKYPDYS